MRPVFDVAVIGGGIVGLAAARELVLRAPGLRVVVLEKESRVAMHQSHRNSGVIHSGLYYKPGSLRATLCVEGAELMYAYCRDHSVPFERCGKLIVATSADELPRLHALLDRGNQNGVRGLRLLDGSAAIEAMEPLITGGIAAIHSPNTGIVDYAEVARAYARDFEAAGGTVRTNVTVRSSQLFGDRVELNGDIAARLVLNCAGLYADRIAVLLGGALAPRLVPVRGDFMALRHGKGFRSMVYPVPNPAMPFLGTHITKKLDGSVWFGPNAMLAFAREGYSLSTFNARDLAELAAHRGLLKLALRNWRWCLGELRSGISKAAYIGQVQRFMPQLRSEDAVPAGSGVRALAVSEAGDVIEDFVIERTERVLSLRNAPSPAATSSLAISRTVASQCLEALHHS